MTIVNEDTLYAIEELAHRIKKEARYACLFGSFFRTEPTIDLTLNEARFLRDELIRLSDAAIQLQEDHEDALREVAALRLVVE